MSMWNLFMMIACALWVFFLVYHLIQEVLDQHVEDREGSPE